MTSLRDKVAAEIEDTTDLEWLERADRILAIVREAEPGGDGKLRRLREWIRSKFSSPMPGSLVELLSMGSVLDKIDRLLAEPATEKPVAPQKKEPNSVDEMLAWANGHRPDNPLADYSAMKCEACGMPYVSWLDAPCQPFIEQKDGTPPPRPDEEIARLAKRLHAEFDEHGSSVLWKVRVHDLLLALAKRIGAKP